MRRANNRAVTATNKVAPFDLKKVKTTADSPVRTNKRIFGIKEAPTFYPTKEEFKDPLDYIEKISPEGEKYGIIKIVPPDDYHPDFCLKTENFHFKTRIQKLNSMEGETRTNVNYLEQLTKYHILAGKPVTKFPQLDKRPIDLYKLKNEVASRGGFQEVTRLKKWAEIGRELGYTRKECTSMSNALKSAYTKVVLPYEIWYAKHKDDVEKVIKKENVEPDFDVDEDTDICEVCKKIENEEKLLLCDGCNRGYHIYCLNPPINSIPKTDWYCIQCLAAVGKDYGFEDGDEYSLTDFQKFSDKFKKEWFQKLSGQDRPVTEEECENEFWRLVENPHEKCEVEYGADLHSTQHGSGFMAPDLMPKDAFDPWNLNVIPVAPQSLFTHIKTDISGMMLPWLYVGMCFSAFCWHNEDHYTYSINYMHWGETKTWYGVPGSDTAKFEETMKKAVPELFEQQPDLLFQLVTMLSPGRLLKENVNVYAVDQRPGQFVVTYPKAYHSGFNHGFNFCEAVNFAPIDWVNHGLECVKLYKAFKKQPCFSHDELLVTAAQNLKTTDKVEWLKEGLKEMQARELVERNQARSKKLKEEPIPEKQLDQELQCFNCHCFTYLSFIGCKCTDKVACVDHISELCTCDTSSKTLFIRYTDTQLGKIIAQVEELSSTSDGWIQKLDSTVTSKPTASIKSLKEHLKQGYKINAPQESLDTLKDYVDVAGQWISDAEKLLNPNSKPTDKHGSTQSQRLGELIDKASLIGCDLPYLDNLKSYSHKLDDFNKALTDQVLISNDVKIKREFYDKGLKIQADSPQFHQLRVELELSTWEENVEKALKSPFDIKVVRKLIKEADGVGFKDRNIRLYQHLVKVESFGKVVLQRIDNICKGKEKIEMHEEENALNMGHNENDESCSIKLDPRTLNRLKECLNKSKDTIENIKNVLYYQNHIPVLDRPSPKEADRMLNLCRDSCFNTNLMSEISSETDRIVSWNEQAKHTFMNGRQKSLDNLLKEILLNVERIVSSEGKQGIWCICRKPESGLMIACEACGEWYHSSCIKAPRKVARSSNSFVCPICSPTEINKKLIYISKQPKLEEVTDLINMSQSLKFCPSDYPVVFRIHSLMQDYRCRVQAFCRSRPQLIEEDIPKIRYYLRTLMGLEVLLHDETDFLKSKLESLDRYSFQHESVLNNSYNGSVSQDQYLLTKNIINNETQNAIPFGTSNFHEIEAEAIACGCKNSFRKDNLIKCESCRNWLHKDCVQKHYLSSKDIQFKCSHCIGHFTEKSIGTPENGSPNSFSTVLNLKRPTEDNLLSKTQKILKLTVNPPMKKLYSQMNSMKKRQNQPTEDKTFTKRQKSTV